MSDDKKILKHNSWSEKAKQRFLKQHGTLDVHDLPQSDAHAIREYDSPIFPPPPTDEEQKAAEALLEEQIKKLKGPHEPASTKPTPVPTPKSVTSKGPEKKPEKEEDQPKNSAGSFYDEWID